MKDKYNIDRKAFEKYELKQPNDGVALASSTSFIQCNHYIEVQFVNGHYVSVCKICGKILDISNKQIY